MAPQTDRRNSVRFVLLQLWKELHLTLLSSLFCCLILPILVDRPEGAEVSLLLYHSPSKTDKPSLCWQELPQEFWSQQQAHKSF